MNYKLIVVPLRLNDEIIYGTRIGVSFDMPASRMLRQTSKRDYPSGRTADAGRARQCAAYVADR